MENRFIIRKSNIVELLTTLWIIYISGVVTFLYNNFSFFLAGTIAMIALLLIWGKAIYSQDNARLSALFIVLGIIVTVQLLISILLGHIYYGSLKLLLMLFFLYLVVLNVKFERFIEYFVRIICIIALISICLYWFNDIIISSGLFPIINTDSVTKYTNLYIYCINSSIVHRNCGVFWEPGAFQIYLNLALLFELYGSHKKKKYRIPVLSIALLTTISTMGYFVFGLIMISYVSQRENKGKLTVLLALGVTALIAGSYLLPIIDSSFSYKFGLGGGGLSTNVTSRINPFLLDLHVIKDNPFGIMGVDYYAEVLRIYEERYMLPFISSSCTHTMIAVVYGLLPGVYFIYSFWRFSKKFVSTVLSSILIFIACISMFATEAFLMHGLYYLLIFYAQKGELNGSLYR